jgi:hypothetical protein
MPMLRRALIAVPLVLLALIVIDFGSWVAIPCAFKPIVPSSGEQPKKDQSSYELCPYNGGIAIAYLSAAGRALALNPEAWIAIGTIVLAIATLGLTLSTRKLALLAGHQAALGERQLKLARDEFLASHRPLMVVHAIRLLDPDSSRPLHQQPLRVEFKVINAGTSAGVVTGSAVYLDVLRDPDLPYLPDLPRNGIIPARRYDVGASDGAVVPNTDARGADLFFGTTQTIAYLSGFVVYEDGQGRARTTFFCRQCTDRFKRQFVHVDDCESNETY